MSLLCKRFTKICFTSLKINNMICIYLFIIFFIGSISYVLLSLQQSILYFLTLLIFKKL